MKDRRKHKRISVITPVKWRIRKSRKQNFTDALLFDTRNVTKRGIFLKTLLRPKHGSTVELEFTPNNSSRPIKLKGKVVWIAKKQTHPRLAPGIGIKFEKMSREDFKKLNIFFRNKSANLRDAVKLKKMYLQLKNMASDLVVMEEKHASAVHFKSVLDNAISEIDTIAHILDKEINEIKKL